MAIQEVTVNATTRTGTGKSVTRKLRAAGEVPAICYGPGEKSLELSVKSADLWETGLADGKNAIIKLVIDAGKGGEHAALMQELQFDFLGRECLHADFLRIDLEKPVKMTVPLRFVGKTAGEKFGGLLHQRRRDLTVSCLPQQIPELIEVDVSGLNINDAIHVSEVALPPGVMAVTEAHLTVATCLGAKAEELGAPVAAVEGEVAAAEGGAEAAKKED